MPNLRALAIYLPQFHPIPENDAWWGRGFTEWTNVTRAKPRFRGHYQPHLPADMGFYDLRVHDTMVEQASLARQYGLDGFCFYHYWFNGKRLLERPVDQLLTHRTPDFPFCLCWANENWTRRWDGHDQEVLMKQEYSDADDRAHIEFLARFFRDPRYIRVQGKPVFIVYRPALLPDIRTTLDTWREVCQKNGVGEVYLMYMESFGEQRTPADMGFDAALEFQPDFWRLGEEITPPSDHIFRKAESVEKKDQVFLYEQVVKTMLQKPAVNYKRYPAVFPMWDNSARRKAEAGIVHQSTPELYGRWLKHVVEKFTPYGEDENFIFINAWNEWAEGNHIEPCRRWGRQYLEATAAVLKSTN